MTIISICSLGLEVIRIHVETDLSGKVIINILEKPRIGSSVLYVCITVCVGKSIPRKTLLSKSEVGLWTWLAF